MGLRKQREGFTAPNFQLNQNFNSTAAIIKNRCVKLLGTGNVTHTTGTSGRAVLGVALAAATGASRKVPVCMFGVVDVHASTRAIAKGDWLRASSGAASTASQLGGTVRKTTVNNQTLGIALTSAAAGAGQRTVTMFLNQTVNAVAVI